MIGSGPLVRGMEGKKHSRLFAVEEDNYARFFCQQNFNLMTYDKQKTRKITITKILQHLVNNNNNSQTTQLQQTLTQTQPSDNREESKDERRWKNGHPAIILSILVYISSFGQTKIKQNTHGRLFFVFLLLNRFS